MAERVKKEETRVILEPSLPGDDSTEEQVLPVLNSGGLPAITPAPGRLPAKDLLNHYLAELRKYPVMSAEEERESARSYYEKGDKSAGERLVTSNLRLVVKIAFQYHRQWSNALDLIQEGNMGLVQALKRYDPYRGIRFSSYAQYWIRAMILRFLMDNYRMVRLGSTRAGRQLFFQLRKERERLLKEGLTPHPKLIAERLSVPENEVVSVEQHMAAPAMSLHAPLGDDDGRSLADIVADDKIDGPETEVVREQLGQVIKERLEAFADTLSDERERAIWYDRLMENEPASLSVLGERFGVSKERIRQIEVRIRKKLKVFLRNELGDEISFDLGNVGSR